MSREDSPYVVGDFWLDKRRDEASPDIWQITTYDRARRQVVYRSTRRKSLGDAKVEIHAHVAKERAKKPQNESEAYVALMLDLYWEEHGKSVVSPGQIASSIRQFIAFMIQDAIGAAAIVADLTPQVFERFRVWRMAPHSYELTWHGKLYKHASPGVNGESVQRNINDVRAALIHNEREKRITAPRIKDIEEGHRSSARERILTPDELIAMLGYAQMHDSALYRFIALQLATAVRPEAAAVFNPGNQWIASRYLDLHPPKWKRTKKVNPRVPMIPELAGVLKAWKADGAKPVASHKRAWRTMRRVLGLSDDVHAKTIRYTVATWLSAVPGIDLTKIEVLLGHRAVRKTTATYAKLDVEFLDDLKAPLSSIWVWAHHGVGQWSAVHSLSKPLRGQPIMLVRKGEEC